MVYPYASTRQMGKGRVETVLFGTPKNVVNNIGVSLVIRAVAITHFLKYCFVQRS